MAKPQSQEKLVKNASRKKIDGNTTDLDLPPKREIDTRTTEQINVF